jgi:hypothetical protein
MSRSRGWGKHDPEKRPIGCNGKYGASGLLKHKREGTDICDACRESEKHYRRELRRGQPLKHPLKPCGTRAAAERHRKRRERLDLACRVAEAKYHADLRAKHIEAVPTGAASVIQGEK